MKKGFSWMAASVALLARGCTSGKSTENIPAVTPFSVERYMGTWYEIARLPHWFESGLDNVSVTYTLREDGRIAVLNRGFNQGNACDTRGVGRLQGCPDIGEFEVSFFRPFYGAYRVIALADDYSSAIVTGSTSDYLWILARTPQLSEEVLGRYVDKIRQWGYEIKALEFPPQTRTR